MGRRGQVSALATLVAVLGIAAGAAAEGGSGRVTDQRIASVGVEQPRADVREYWTAARMRAAEPANLQLTVSDAVNESLAGGSPAGRPSYVAASRPAPAMRSSDVSAESALAPRRVHGKVFFTLGTQNFVCSATVVSSASRALVWTAAHCVHGADVGAGFATNWIFVPGYRDGLRPFGTWPARRLFAAQEWIDEANVRYDLGAAALGRDPQGRGLEDLIGARGIAFNQPRNQTFDAYGYPAEDGNTILLPPNFDGERLWLCSSPRSANDSPSSVGGPETMEIGCDMTGGSSGGSWVIGDEFVNSVTSYGYELDPGHLYGPYFGTVAEALYANASGPPQLCAAVQVTNLGSGAANDFAGTALADSFRLFGGDDRAVADAGDDFACGGGGADRLVGVDGGDELRGGGGDDVLVGGPGRDVCDGGSGRDRALGCEERRRIP